ncbi:MAG: hypothetical protein QOK37_936 [Thermoanaerobaculia bacterium]|nr:hypothetical protein [Thermoanaerobaculia bacterium]
MLLLLAIFGTVIVFALVLIQQHFVQSISDPFGRTIFVYDSTQPAGKSLLIGRAVSFNQYEAPQVLYRITDAGTPPKHYAALLGVRPANFTTRPAVYYDDPGCTGGPWILDPNNALSGASGEVSDFYSLQGVAFAIGKDGSSNVLYRTSTLVTHPAVLSPQSRWVSEAYSANCQPVTADAALQAALIPATELWDMSTKFIPPYWTPVQVYGTPLSAATAPQKEGDPWP